MIRLAQYDHQWGDLEVEIYNHTIILREDAISFGRKCRIDSFVKLEGGAGIHFGTHVHIASYAHLNIGGGKLFMGDHSCVASHGCVITGGDRPDGQSMSACSPLNMQVLKANEVHIERYAAVLSGAIILPGVTLHEGAIAAAGAVITKDIPAWEIWGGNPGHFLALRPRPWATGHPLVGSPSLAQPGEPAPGLTPALKALDDDMRRMVPRPWEDGAGPVEPRTSGLHPVFTVANCTCRHCIAARATLIGHSEYRDGNSVTRTCETQDVTLASDGGTKVLR